MEQNFIALGSVTIIAQYELVFSQQTDIKHNKTINNHNNKFVCV